ncbi:MAG: DUF4349 domain-containing protein [Planctomycetota bacterium]
MTDELAPDIEQQLTNLTTWQGPTPNLWRRALAATQARSDRTGIRRIFHRRIPSWVVPTVAAAMIFIAVGVSMKEKRAVSLSNFRGIGQGLLIYANDTEEWFPQNHYDIPGYSGLSSSYQMLDKGRGGRGARGGGGVSTPAPYEADVKLYCAFGAGEAASSTLDRHVIRKATIELLTPDVRAAFLKASHLISTAQGEYVQDSGVTGSGNRTEANLTLRVVATRLPEVLNELRQLGEVRSEQTAGEDVTTQVVDIEARLRNEQRVETELLELVEKRQDAPLKEILELRTALGQVRQTIETLTAQRERLDRLVSLATVLVIIRPADAPAPVEDAGVIAYFLKAVGNAWNKGLLFLADTLAGFLSVIIGGLVWWLLLIVALLAWRTYRLRNAKSNN